MLRSSGLFALGLTAALAWADGSIVRAVPADALTAGWQQQGQRGRQQAQRGTPPGQQRQQAQQRTPPGQQRQQAERRTPPGQQRQQAQQRTPPGQQRQQAQKRTPPGQQRQQAQKGTPPGQQRQQAERRTPPGQQRQLDRGSSDRVRWPAGRPPAAVIGRSVRELPERFSPVITSSRPSDLLLLGALAFGAVRGLDVEQLGFTTHPGAVLVANRRGETLFHLSDNRARTLGAWHMRRLGDQRPRGNAPAFCRSGEGHPVWGREWCIDKGFGLGSRSGSIWSRSRVDDVVFLRPVTADRLRRDDLLGILGDVVFNRLAVHSVALGYSEPLHGVWIAEPDAPQILRVHSGDIVVAELVDLDRDDRVEVLYIVQPL